MQPKPIALSPAHWTALGLHELSLSGFVAAPVGHLLRSYSRRLRRIGDRQMFHRSLALVHAELLKALIRGRTPVVTLPLEAEHWTYFTGPLADTLSVFQLFLTLRRSSVSTVTLCHRLGEGVASTSNATEDSILADIVSAFVGWPFVTVVASTSEWQ